MSTPRALSHKKDYVIGERLKQILSRKHAEQISKQIHSKVKRESKLETTYLKLPNQLTNSTYVFFNIQLRSTPNSIFSYLHRIKVLNITQDTCTNYLYLPYIFKTPY